MNQKFIDHMKDQEEELDHAYHALGEAKQRFDGLTNYINELKLECDHLLPDGRQAIHQYDITLLPHCRICGRTVSQSPGSTTTHAATNAPLQG